MFHIYEDFFLLMLDEKKGKLSNKNRRVLPIGLAGAILAELIQMGRIEVVETYLVQLNDASPIGNRVLDLAVRAIQKEAPLQTVGTWVRILASQSDMVLHSLLANLTDKCIIQEYPQLVLWIPTGKRFPLSDPSVRTWLGRRLRTIVLAATPPGPDELSLLGLLAACDRLSLIFDSYEMRFAPRWVSLLTQDDPVHQAVQLVYQMRKIEKLPQPNPNIM